MNTTQINDFDSLAMSDGLGIFEGILADIVEHADEISEEESTTSTDNAD